jgi:exodeoxyribonuclease VII large subunit
MKGMIDRQTISVSQLNNYIKNVFEAEEMLHGVCVAGDIDGISVRGSAVYFTLKDVEAAIPCVCYYPQKLQGVKSGANVIVRGTVSYWHKAGKISFVVTSVEQNGLGALMAAFNALKEKLEREGLFDALTKKPLPREIKRVGLVTSKSGAVLHDIKTVIRRRNPSVDIVLYPVAVQGECVDTKIAAAIEFLSKYNVDVIIVARGGGSSQDLSCFNSERIARAVFASRVPVVSAVGHETDWTLIDLVADLRAATPSVAAELVVPEIISRRDVLLKSWHHACYILRNRADIPFSRIRLAYQSLRTNMLYRTETRDNMLRMHLNYTDKNNPLAILKTGYAKVFKDDSEVHTIDKVKIGDNLRIKLHDGEINATASTIKNSPSIGRGGGEADGVGFKK